jgi:hypothetical protein
VGSAKSHSEIAIDVTRTLARELSGAGMHAEEDLQFIELGNWLTDVSQARDPFAHISAKQRLLEKARSEVPWILQIMKDPILRLWRAPATFDALLGTPAARHGALAAYLEQIIVAVTALRFKTLSDADLDEAFRTGFSQYFPHEHLDFPPPSPPRFRLDDPVGDRSVDAGARVPKYLRRQMAYLVESFAELEGDWIAARRQTAKQRRQILLRYGHISHTFEDFFFHSNFLEIAQYHRVAALREAWRKAGDARAQAPPLPDGFPGVGHPDPSVRWFMEHCLKHDHREVDSPRTRRVLFRRLRVPRADGRALSRLDSGDGHDVVFTGGFASNDIFHTLYGILTGLEHDLSAELPPLLPSRTAKEALASPIVLLDFILREARRKTLKERATLDAVVRTHREQLASPAHEALLRAATSVVRPRAAAAIRAAYRLDREIVRKHGVGPGELLLHVANLLQAEHEASAAASATLDETTRYFDKQVGQVLVDAVPASADGASAEEVGSHSLLAKDSPESGPLREEAMVLARFAAAFMAQVMARRVRAAAPGDGKVVDWRRLVEHFIGYPTAAGAGWEREVLDKKVRTTGDETVLEKVGKLTRPPPVELVARGSPGNAAVRRTLERQYLMLEHAAETAYRAALAGR